MLRNLILLFSFLFVFSGCRYWSLYKFGDQFCEYDEHVKVSLQADALSIDFLDPVLPRNVLLRYLHAQAFQTSYKAENEAVRSDLFRIRRTEYMAANPFSFEVTYALDGETPVLRNAILDPALSQLFGPALTEPILQSICSDDYDLSLKRLDMRFVLKNIQSQDLPDKLSLESVFGNAARVEYGIDKQPTLHYQFDFMRGDNSARDNVYQNRPIQFAFGFDKKSKLVNLHILYHKYDYWLDFETLSGRLIVVRN